MKDNEIARYEVNLQNRSALFWNYCCIRFYAPLALIDQLLNHWDKLRKRKRFLEVCICPQANRLNTIFFLRFSRSHHDRYRFQSWRRSDPLANLKAIHTRQDGIKDNQIDLRFIQDM